MPRQADLTEHGTGPAQVEDHRNAGLCPENLRGILKRWLRSRTGKDHDWLRVAGEGRRGDSYREDNPGKATHQRHWSLRQNNQKSHGSQPILCFRVYALSAEVVCLPDALPGGSILVADPVTAYDR